MPTKRVAAQHVLTLTTCVAIGLAAGCSSAAPDGRLIVSVTLSRGAGVGPTYDHAPQRGEVVRVVDSAGRARTALTGPDGRAELALLPGEFGVTTDSCPNGPVVATVRSHKVTRVAVDCVAP